MVFNYKETDKLFDWMKDEWNENGNNSEKLHKISKVIFKMLDRRGKYLRIKKCIGAAMLTFEILLLIVWCCYCWENIF
jgi:hypothetical protein